MPLLIVRPQPGADATAARARALELEPVSVPLFAIKPIDWTPPDSEHFDALLLTSANAVRHAGEAVSRYAALPTFAVGHATQAAANASGLGVVATGDSGVEAILPVIEEKGWTRVLHLAGRDHHPYPPTALQVTTCIVYAAIETDAALPDPPYVALLHSERAATRLAQLASDRAAIAIVAISSDVATAAGLGWRHVAIAPTSEDAAMLALAARLCEEGTMPTTGAA